MIIKITFMNLHLINFDGEIKVKKSNLLLIAFVVQFCNAFHTSKKCQLSQIETADMILEFVHK